MEPVAAALCWRYCLGSVVIPTRDLQKGHPAEPREKIRPSSTARSSASGLRQNKGSLQRHSPPRLTYAVHRAYLRSLRGILLIHIRSFVRVLPWCHLGFPHCVWILGWPSWTSVHFSGDWMCNRDRSIYPHRPYVLPSKNLATEEGGKQQAIAA